MGRRVRKEVLAWDDGASDWAAMATTDLKFVFDGWNVVQVLDGTTTGNPVTRQYTWGLDLSGTVGGAGGIGGLLAVHEVAGTYAGNSYWFAYDGNGNVGQVLKYVTNPSIAVTRAAHYEYDPYGNIIVASDEDSSDYVTANPIRFSTKWFDAETGLYYYGYRYLWCGRWLNRDPIEEGGGLNLYGFANNTPTTAGDADGRIIVGLGGLIGSSGRPQIQAIGRNIASQVNDWRKRQSPALPPDKFVYLDGSTGLGAGALASLAEGWRKRRFPDGKRDPCVVEGFVLFGYSDGATTIYHFLRTDADRSLAVPPRGIAYLSYVGYIDMVRTSFWAAPKRNPEPEDRVLPLSQDYAFHRDAYYQESDVFDLVTYGWKGFTQIGGSGGFQYRPTNHIGLISAPVLHADVTRQAVRAYIEHAARQIVLNQQ